MIFEQDFIEFIELLNKHDAKYMIVGAHALSFHGRPRHTGDLDIWIKPNNENAEKLVQVMKDFGFGSLGLSREDFLKEDSVTQLGYPPLRIDILNSISGVEFDEGYDSKITADIDGLTVHFINIGHFIANKMAVGRNKDLGDIEALQELKKEQEQSKEPPDDSFSIQEKRKRPGF